MWFSSDSVLLHSLIRSLYLNLTYYWRLTGRLESYTASEAERTVARNAVLGNCSFWRISSQMSIEHRVPKWHCSKRKVLGRSCLIFAFHGYPDLVFEFLFLIILLYISSYIMFYVYILLFYASTYGDTKIVLIFKRTLSETMKCTFKYRRRNVFSTPWN